MISLWQRRSTGGNRDLAVPPATPANTGNISIVGPVYAPIFTPAFLIAVLVYTV